MTTIKPIGSAPASSVTPAPAPVADAAPILTPQDAFAYGTTLGQPADDPMKSFWRQSQDLSQSLAAQASLGTPEPVVTDQTAGWQTHLFEPHGGGCYVKVALEGESILVMPLENGSGGGFGKPVVADARQGIIATPDVQPFGSPMCFRAEKSPDGERVYLRGGTTSSLRIYDRDLANGVEVDVASLHPDFGSVRDFRSGRQVDVAVVTHRDKDKDGGFVIGLDPKSHQAVFTTPVESCLSWGIDEDPQGNFYVPLQKGFGQEATHAIRMFSSTGQDLGSIPTSDTAHDLTFRGDGLTVFNQGRSGGVRAMVASEPGKVSEKWSIADKNYQKFQFSADGKYLYAMDPCEGFSRSHVLVKIDAENGAVVWERKAYGEHFADMRVVGDDLYLLTAGNQGAERDVIHMRKFDASNTLTWEDKQKLGEMDEYPEGMEGSITAQGNFVFGGRGNGNLYFLHPRQPGETEDSIRDAVRHSSDIVADSQKKLEESVQQASATAVAQAPTLEMHDDFILVGGVRVPRRAD